MSLKTLNILLILWYSGLVLVSPFLVTFIGSMLFFFYFSGYGSTEPQSLYLLFAALPVIVIILTTVTLHTLRRTKMREQINTAIRAELSTAETQLSPEAAVLAALELSRPLSLAQLSERTRMSSADLLPILNTLADSGKIQRSSSLDGIFFNRAD